MSDFDGVEWLDVEQISKRKEIAPAGEHEVKVVAAEKYKSEAGNWTVKVSFEFSDGDYREHNEWYNLWAANAGEYLTSKKNAAPSSKSKPPF
jgi:hypothetical protein